MKADQIIVADVLTRGAEAVPCSARGPAITACLLRALSPRAVTRMCLPRSVVRATLRAPGSVACLLLSGEAGGVVEGAVSSGASRTSERPIVWRLRVRRGHARAADAVHAHTVGTPTEIVLHTAHTCIRVHPAPHAPPGRGRCMHKDLLLLPRAVHHISAYVTIYHSGTLSIIMFQRSQRAENKGWGGVVLTHCRVMSYPELTKVEEKI